MKKRQTQIAGWLGVVVLLVVMTNCAPDTEEEKWTKLQTQAEQGDADAQYELGTRYQFGSGVEKDYDKAAEWLIKAAKQGHSIAQHLLRRPWSDEAMGSVEWWHKLVEQGYANAQNYLGDAYWHGVEKDRHKAMEWYRKAADQGEGDASALSTVAMAYMDGEGVAKNPRKAVEWWRKAAEQEFAYLAQYALGRAYEEGYGVEKDPRKSDAWYRRSSRTMKEYNKMRKKQ